MKDQANEQKKLGVEKKVLAKDFNPLVVYLVCLAVALIFMFFFGLNSPIHTFNPFCDFNWYVTMGRGILDGKVPYRDLFDHKGPITYFVYAFATIFPNYQFVVWVLEVLCISLFLFFCYRIARKFLTPWLCLVVIPLMMMVLSTNFCRLLNASCVEEFCLPIFGYGLLCFLDFIMDHRQVSWQRSLAIGICFGILFWVKYSMLEFFLVPMLIWLFSNLLRRNFKQLILSCLIMLGGLLVITLPILIYFLANGALGNLFEVYFKLNLGSYSGDYSGLTEQQMFVRKWKNALQVFGLGAYFIVFFFVGIVCFVVQNWKQKSGWILLVVVLTTWIMVGFFCGFKYYYIPLYAYTVLGCVYMIKYLVKFIMFYFYHTQIFFEKCWPKVLAISLVASSCFFLALPFVLNIVEINRARENYTPLVVADIISDYNKTAKRSATLFCYDMVDYGFYNAAGIVPNIKFFARSAFTPEVFPEMYEDFDETILKQKCDFVITYKYQIEQKSKFFLKYYDFYYGTLESSTLKYVLFDGKREYITAEFVILFRRSE